MLLKSKRHLLLVQNTIKGIKEDINIVKCNIATLHKAVIPRTKSTETLKNLWPITKRERFIHIRCAVAFWEIDML